MNKKKQRRRRHARAGMTGIIHRVLDGLGDALGIGRGLVIAGFVVGFVFVPLLSLAVFLGGWYWISYPEQTRRHFRRISAYAQRVSAAAFATNTRATAPQPDIDERETNASSASTPNKQSPTTAELRARFESLDARARAIEEFVASEEYRLEREFWGLQD
jgi:phage shock protein PspC (stress-responsive transcriptional regulator)